MVTSAFVIGLHCICISVFFGLAFVFLNENSLPRTYIFVLKQKTLLIARLFAMALINYLRFWKKYHYGCRLERVFGSGREGFVKIIPCN